MNNFLKSNVDHTLNRLHITVRDENDEPKSADELAKEVMAYLEKCTPEYANQILFELDIAAAIDRAAGNVERCYWGGLR